jgi:hypothetical protein
MRIKLGKSNIKRNNAQTYSVRYFFQLFEAIEAQDGENEFGAAPSGTSSDSPF